MSIIPPAFSNYHDHDLATRLTLAPDGKAVPDGRQKQLNLLGRAWDCLTRSSEKVEANKATARAFIDGIQGGYGKEIANMASRELSAHLAKGRPLTSYRVHRTLVKADKMLNRIAARNNRVVRENRDSLVNTALRSAFGTDELPSSKVIEKGKLLKAMSQAITSDPTYSKVSFKRNPEALVKRYGDIAAKRAEWAINEELLPNAMTIINRDGNKQAKVKDELQMNHLNRLQIPMDEQQTFAMTLTFLDATMMKLVRPDSEVLTPNTAAVHLGQIEYLERQLSPDNPHGEPRLIDLKGLSPQAQEFRDAILEDMRGLVVRIGDEVGFKSLPQNVQTALRDGNRLAGDLEGDLDEGRWGNISKNMEQSIETLTTLVETLNTAGNVVDPGARAAIESVKTRCEDAIGALRDMDATTTKGFSPEDSARMRRKGLDVTQALARFSDEEVQLLRGAGHGIELGLEYKDRQVPIHPRTMVTDFVGEKISGQPRKLTGGALSSPFEVNYKMPDNGIERAVFKEARVGEGMGPASDTLGIDKANPRMAVRNVATKIVDELLDFHVVAETRFGTLNGKLGMVMSFATGVQPTPMREVDITDQDFGQTLLAVIKGDPSQAPDMREAFKVVVRDDRVLQLQPHSITEINYDNPELRRDLVKLQLLDALCGQGDRHGENYFVELDTKGNYSRLVAIDNDQAFGTKTNDPNQLLFRQEGNQVDINGKKYGDPSMRGVLLPEVIDTDMQKTFMTLTPEALKNSLSGLLNDAEIDSALQRLDAIKQHITNLPDSQIISPHAWGSDVATQALRDPDRSYVGRERLDQQQKPNIRYQDVAL